MEPSHARGIDPTGESLRRQADSGVFAVQGANFTRNLPRRRAGSGRLELWRVRFSKGSDLPMGRLGTERILWSWNLKESDLAPGGQGLGSILSSCILH